MVNQIDTAENQNENKPAVPKKSSVKMKIWNIACILLFAAGIVFLIIYWGQVHYDIPIINYKWIVLVSALAALVIIGICFFRTLTTIGAVKFIALILAAAILAAGWYIYFRYIPKYGPHDGCAIVKADPRYSSATVEPQYEEVPQFFSYEGITVRTGPNMKCNILYKNKDNPFCDWGYSLNVIKDGKVIAWIGFDSATGKYESYEPQD